MPAPNPFQLHTGLGMGRLGAQSPIIGRLPDGRAIIRNADGTVSTHRNMIMEFDGLQFIVPTIFNGQQVAEDEAIDIIRRNNFIDPDTGKPLPRFGTLEEAQKFEAAQRPFLEEIGMMLQQTRGQ